MTQYIDKNKVEEILRNLWKKDDSHNAEHRICYNKALQEVQCELDALEVKEVSSENPDERMIAKYLYEKKGYPIDLNGNIPSFEETMMDVEKYNKYKENKFIEKFEKWIKNMYSETDYRFKEDFTGMLINDFKNYVGGE